MSSSIVYIRQLLIAFIRFLVDLHESRSLILQLTFREFKIRYLGSYLGLAWAFIQPTFTILIFWFVFEVGFKSAPVDNFPFILWLVCGILPWFYIAEALGSGTNSIFENSYLVKKVVFRISILPIVKLLSALMIHAFFLIIIFLLFLAYGIYPTVYNLQVFYYTFAATVLMLGTVWLTASLVVFLKDVNQLITMVLQFGFWLTPIFWSLDMIPTKYQIFIKLNPVYYIIQGYRDSFINLIWFWEHPLYTLYYWIVTFIIIVIGALVFTRLRPHFADVM